jgi:hypothetical protein
VHGLEVLVPRRHAAMAVLLLRACGAPLLPACSPGSPAGAPARIGEGGGARQRGEGGGALVGEQRRRAEEPRCGVGERRGMGGRGRWGKKKGERG